MEIEEAQRHDRMDDDLPRVSLKEIATDDNGEEIEISISQKMLSAVIGSVLTSLLVTPLDVVRVRLQSQSQPGISRIRNMQGMSSSTFTNLPPNLGVTACCREVFWVNNNAPFCVVENSAAAAVGDSPVALTDCAAEESQRKTFTSTLDGLKKIARNEGLSTLWRGLSPTLVMAVPANVIYFSGYDWLRTSSRSPMHGRVNDLYAPLVAGSTARVLAALVVSPIELLRTRMQASNSQGAGSNLRQTLSGVNEMVATQGYKSLWRGLTLTLWRDVPFSALYWWGYEATRNSITNARERASCSEVNAFVTDTRLRSKPRSQQDRFQTLVDSFAAGAFSGAIASVITTPFDVGKTRQQVFKYSDVAGSSAKQATKKLLPEEKSMPRLLWHIFREEGAAGLFRGWVARTLKVAPACAIMISTYEVGKRMAYDMRKDNLER